MLLKLKGNDGAITNGYKLEQNISTLRTRIVFPIISLVEPFFSAGSGITSPR